MYYLLMHLGLCCLGYCLFAGFGLTCMQTEWYWGILTGVGEDCLNMDIYVPNNSTPPPGGYPVMLFWYGGSFTFGESTCSCANCMRTACSASL